MFYLPADAEQQFHLKQYHFFVFLTKATFLNMRNIRFFVLWADWPQICRGIVLHTRSSHLQSRRWRLPHVRRIQSRGPPPEGTVLNLDTTVKSAYAWLKKEDIKNNYCTTRLRTVIFNPNNQCVEYFLCFLLKYWNAVGCIPFIRFVLFVSVQNVIFYHFIYRVKLRKNTSQH